MINVWVNLLAPSSTVMNCGAPTGHKVLVGHNTMTKFDTIFKLRQTKK